MDEFRKPDDTNELRRTLLALLPGLALADAASAQDAVKAQPHSYRIAFENDKLRVLEYRGRPGMGACGEGRHSHPPHLTVMLFGGKVRLRTPEGQVSDHEVKVGQVLWSEAETHEVENISSRDSHMLLVELKPGAGKT